ncbi:MAG: polymer-forming cytoskeletal protein [Nitrospiraceae bacterium]|jgi:cytoskeletal protein CcmA (bactofilin family)
MKGSREASPEAKSLVSTIGPGLRVIGDCISDGVIRIAGRVEGGIKAAEVVVEKGGRVQGDIQTQNLIVAGQVSGNIAARGRAEFEASCQVEGDILSPRIKMEEGGRIDGRLNMSAGPSKPNATTLEPPG